MTRRQIISATVLCIYLAAVAFLCFGKPEDMPQVPSLWFGIPADKAGHFLMFLPYPLLAYLVFETKGISVMRYVAIITVILVAGGGLAIGTEHIQALLDYREADIKDLYADAGGLVTGGICAIAYIYFRRNK